MMQDAGTSSSTSHVAVRPCEAVQTVVVSERRWGDSSGLDCSNDAWIGLQLVERRIRARMVEAKLMAAGWNLILRDDY
jgi:hypothetical protein